MNSHRTLIRTIKFSYGFIFASLLASITLFQVIDAKAQPESAGIISTSPVVVTSPDGTLSGAIFVNGSSGLSYQVTWNGHPVGGPGHIGLRFVSTNQLTPLEIGFRPVFGDISRDQIDEQY